MAFWGGAASEYCSSKGLAQVNGAFAARTRVTDGDYRRRTEDTDGGTDELVATGTGVGRDHTIIYITPTDHNYTDHARNGDASRCWTRGYSGAHKHCRSVLVGAVRTILSSPGGSWRRVFCVVIK